MKAKAQYNDFVGTAAADISDFHDHSIEDFLVKEFPKFDKHRYGCKGCAINISGQYTSPIVSIHFICFDKEQMKYVRLCPLRDMKFDEVFSLFKRFNVVIGNGMEEIEVKDEDWIDL